MTVRKRSKLIEQNFRASGAARKDDLVRVKCAESQIESLRLAARGLLPPNREAEVGQFSIERPSCVSVLDDHSIGIPFERARLNRFLQIRIVKSPLDDVHQAPSRPVETKDAHSGVIAIRRIAYGRIEADRDVSQLIARERLIYKTQSR